MENNYEAVLVSKNEHIGTITLNRPDNLNTFNSALAHDLNNALNEFERDGDIRVVVVNAKGKAFCAGIDVNEIKGKNSLELYRWVELMEKMSSTMAGMGKPVIASVQGVAVANGIGLVASADLAIASQNARFGATAVNVGLFCMGPAVPLSRHLGRKKALELLLTGDIIDAVEAEHLGLVNKVVPRESLEQETLELAQRIAIKSPLAVQLGKRSFYQMCDLEYGKALELTSNHFAVLCSTEDANEGVKAFFEKREPNWKLK